MAPRRPTRLLEYANKSSAYPRELLANLDSGELTLIDNNGNEVATNPLSTETSGTGNAVKEITVNGRKIIITKATYLTEHPTIHTSADGTDTAANPGFGGTFNVVSTITRDGNGHVTQIKTKTVTMPSQPTSVSGNAGTATKLAAAKNIALSGDVTGSTNFDGSKNVTITATLANSGVTADSYGPTADTTANAGDTFVVPQVTVDAKGRVTSVTERNITLPATPGSVGTADKLTVARSISLSGGATGSTTFDGSADSTINVTSLDATKLTGTVPLSSIPKGAQERLVPVENQTAMLALTSNDVQNGDVVKLEDTGVMYYVADDTLLGSIDAFSVFTAGAASSVPWSGVTDKPSITPAGTVSNTSITPKGTVSSTFTGTAAEHNHTFTGSRATINSSYTPAGNVASTFTGTAAEHNHTFTGTAAEHNHTFTGSRATINSSYTPAGAIGNATPTGKVSSSFTGSAVTSTAPSANTTFNQITGVGSLPTMSASVANKCLKITFGQGSLPTSASVTVASSAHAHNVTASGSVSSTFTGDAHSHTFTGTAGNATATYTPAGTIANKSITPAGTIANTSVTPAGSVASTFTGTAGNATATYTPAGTIANKSITPAGTIKSTFSGNAISHNHTFTGNNISL